MTLRARAVSAASDAASGFGRIDSVPVSMAPTYCISPPGMERGMLRTFGADASPLPLRMNTWRPSRLIDAAVGYQPVGMNPSTWLRPGTETSTTATVLLSAFATSSRLSSGDRLTQLGVDPDGASG